MNNQSIYNLIIEKQIKKLVEKYNPYSIYITGSFASVSDWILGISDIDIKVFTETINDSESLSVQYCVAPNNWISIPVNVSVYTLKEFSDPQIYAQYANGENKKSEIILDQLYMGGIKELVFGLPLKLPNIEPEDIREYAYMNRKFYERNYGEGILLEEIKRIFFAVRVFHFLWHGYYLYDLEQLLYSISNKSWNQSVVDIYRESVEIYKLIKIGEYTVFNAEYVKYALRFKRLRKKICDLLCDNDKMAYSKKQELIINENFICHQGFVG